jgi:putative transcriptional regulator
MKNSIRQLRTRLGLSQAAVALEVGVSRQAINAIENCRHDPSVSLAFAIARALQARIDEVFHPDAEDT